MPQFVCANVSSKAECRRALTPIALFLKRLSTWAAFAQCGGIGAVLTATTPPPLSTTRFQEVAADGAEARALVMLTGDMVKKSVSRIARTAAPAVAATYVDDDDAAAAAAAAAAADDDDDDAIDRVDTGDFDDLRDTKAALQFGVVAYVTGAALLALCRRYGGELREVLRVVEARVAHSGPLVASRSFATSA
jgi:hypothetical protein